MKTWALAGIATLLMASGCHSAYVEADVINASGSTIHLVEVDYPSASFGVQLLAAGATYHYRFKVLGSGNAKVLWTDAQQHDHTVTGPQLFEGQAGTLQVRVLGSTAEWQAKLRP